MNRLRCRGACHPVARPCRPPRHVQANSWAGLRACELGFPFRNSRIRHLPSLYQKPVVLRGSQFAYRCRGQRRNRRGVAYRTSRFSSGLTNPEPPHDGIITSYCKWQKRVKWLCSFQRIGFPLHPVWTLRGPYTVDVFVVAFFLPERHPAWVGIRS